VPFPTETPPNKQRCAAEVLVQRLGWASCWIHGGHANFLKRRSILKSSSEDTRLRVLHELKHKIEAARSVVESELFQEAMQQYSWSRIVNKINLMFVLGIEAADSPFAIL
jgi:hypothetical protein